MNWLDVGHLLKSDFENTSYVCVANSSPVHSRTALRVNLILYFVICALLATTIRHGLDFEGM